MTDSEHALPPKHVFGEAAVRYVRHGIQDTQRFGQYFINEYMPSGSVWPELFHELDTFAAMELIAKQYAVQESAAWATTNESTSSELNDANNASRRTP